MKGRRAKVEGEEDIRYEEALALVGSADCKEGKSV
jgi:hypothetical protein